MKVLIALTATLSLAPLQPACAGKPQATQTGSDAQIMVTDRESEKGYILVGVMARGGDANLEKLEAAARAAGAFPAARTHEPGTTVGKTMVVFRPGSDVKLLRGFYDRARAMDFGFVLIDVMVVAPEDARDGITSKDVKVRELADFAE
ncbi:MAG: hypothetical protein ABIO86_21835 [Sphingomonas sp.]